MTNVEKEIVEKFGRENHFTVPEGYFDQLQKNIMDSLPEQQTKVVKMTPRRRFLLPVISAAASVCVAVCGVSIWLHETTAEPVSQEISLSNTKPQTIITDSDNADDYIMMDNEDIYRYMSQN